MTRLTTMLIAVALLLTGGLAYGQQETGPHFDHLKSHQAIIGTWRYEGPLPEDMPGFAEKGSDCVAQITWRWILNKNAIEAIWSTEFAGDKQISGKGLIGWHAADEKIVFSGMDSTGIISVGTIEFNDDEKSSTLTSEGTDGEGKPVSGKAVVKRIDKDTLTFRALTRSGGVAEEEGPVYTYKRVKRARGKKADN